MTDVKYSLHTAQNWMKLKIIYQPCCTLSSVMTEVLFLSNLLLLVIQLMKELFSDTALHFNEAFNEFSLIEMRDNKLVYFVL